MSLEKSHQLLKIYENSQLEVRKFGFDGDRARQEYAPYISFIETQINLSHLDVLDVGCGNGWTSYLLSEHAHNVTAMDLHRENFEPPIGARLEYIPGSATQMPFAAGSFDLVTTHECLEHVADPKQALAEFDRVLKPGGYVVIVGPNLLSWLQSVRGIVFYVWKNRPIRRIFFRDKKMPKHPHGNTLFEILFCFLRNLFYSLKLSLLGRPLFLLREPDLVAPFHADNDACYFLNPLDLKHHFTQKKYEILKIKKHKYLPSLFSSGTWFVARKKE